MSPRFSHIINPFLPNAGSDWHRVQQITLQSLDQAIRASEPSAELIACCLPDDCPTLPASIQKIAPLQTHSGHIPELTHKNRKLTWIQEVLEKGAALAEAPYVIYTNMDIIVQPFFYDAIQAYLNQGYDCLIINRRRIPDQNYQPHDLPMILSKVGKSHPGFDCFVFPTDWISQFQLDRILVGIPFLEAGLIYNVMAVSENMGVITDAHLTTHLGQVVMPERYDDWYQHNRNQFFNHIYPALKPQLTASKLPYAQDPFFQRTWKRALNPAIFSVPGLELEGKSLKQRLKRYWDELRFHWLEPD